MTFDRTKRQFLWRITLMGYALLMIWLMFFRSRSGIWVDSSDYLNRLREQINLRPLRMILDYWDILTRREYYIEKWEAASIYRYHARQAFINLFGNIGMLIPLGFLLPGNFEKLRTLFKTLLAVAGIILTVELLQLLTLAGHCDIDDLILNLLGASIGYGLYRLLHAVTEKHRHK